MGGGGHERNEKLNGVEKLSNCGILKWNTCRKGIIRPRSDNVRERESVVRWKNPPLMFMFFIWSPMFFFKSNVLLRILQHLNPWS